MNKICVYKSTILKDLSLLFKNLEIVNIQ